MRNWLIAAAVLIAGPANASELIANGDFNASQSAITLTRETTKGPSAAADWGLYNNSNARTFSEIVANFGGRTNLLHIVTDGSANGAYQLLLDNAFSGFADIFVVSGRASFRGYVDGKTSVALARTSSHGVFERLTLNPDDPFNFVVFYSYGAGADFYVDLASARSPGAAAGAVPEPATWAMMLVGFGAVGGALRRRPKVATRIRFS